MQGDEMGVQHDEVGDEVGPDLYSATLTLDRPST